MKPLTTTLAVLLTFLLVQFGKNFIYQLLGIDLRTSPLPLAMKRHMLIWYIVLPLFVLMALHGVAKGWAELGWQTNVIQGGVIAMIMTAPMLVGCIVFFKPVDFTQSPTWQDLYYGALWAGLSEETFYRAFIFGQLYYYGRWPFLLAALVQAVLFGMGHLYQAHDMAQAVGIFAVTALGAVWFGWLWLAWRNLWVPVLVHVLMNAWWMSFSVAPTAFGGWLSNGLRVLTIGLSIWLTIVELGKQRRLINLRQAPTSAPLVDESK